MFHDLFLHPASSKKLRAYTDQEFGEGPWSIIHHFNETHVLLVAKSHGIFYFCLHLKLSAAFDVVDFSLFPKEFLSLIWLVHFPSL